MDEQWETPDADPGALSAEEGPNVVKALWDDISENLVGYVLSGLVVFAVSMLVALPMALLGGGAMVAGGVADDPTWTPVAMSIGGLIFVGGTLVLVAILPLMAASLMRAIDAQRMGYGSVTWSSSFSTMSQDAVRVVLMSLVGALLTTVAGALCFLPAIPMVALWSFATPIVVLEGAGIGTALGVAARHMGANLLWHIVVWLIAFLIWMVLEATGIGTLFVVPIFAGYQVFAYRAAFGEAGAAMA